MAWNPRGQAYSLPLTTQENRNLQPVSMSNIGNIYPVASNQQLSVSVESIKPRLVLLSNVGSIPLTITDSQRAFPFGLRLPCGTVMELVTSSALWVSAPKSVLVNPPGIPAIVASIGYVSVSVAA